MAQADIGLIPIAALATSPELRILPGCTIASKGRVRSLLLVHRAWQPLTDLQSVAADTASRTTLAYARILFHKWGNQGCSVPAHGRRSGPDAGARRCRHPDRRSRAAGSRRALQPLGAHRRGACLSRPGRGVERADRAAVRLGRLGRCCSSSPFGREYCPKTSSARAIMGSRTSTRWWPSGPNEFPIPEETIRSYLTTNIHYVLDDECVEGMRGFFRMAAECGVLPPYTVALEELVAR